MRVRIIHTIDARSWLIRFGVHAALTVHGLAVLTINCIVYKYKKQLQKIEKKVGMEYQIAYKQG